MVDCYNIPEPMPLAQAKALLLEAVSAVKEVELIAIEEALNRVIAAPVTSLIDVPGCNNSAMDGYAICDQTLTDKSGQDNAVPLNEFKLIGTALAGQVFQGSLGHGECIRIMTGAKVPDGANAVVMQENTEKSDIGIRVNGRTSYQDNIRFAGEDIQKGQNVLNAGHRLNSVGIGLLASLGVAEVKVYRKVKVAVISTGDELKMPGESLNDGDIYESNGPTIRSLLHKLNVEIINLGIIRDDINSIRNALLNADKQADIVITSGGVSVGDADYIKIVMDDIGKIDFWKVAIKPGKPFAFGTLPNSLLIGLPGNPVSSTVTFDILARYAIQKLAGEALKEKLLLNAVATTAIRKRPGRMDFQRAIASTNEQGHLQVTPLPRQGSGILTSMNNANCYIRLSLEDGAKAAGDMVQIQLFDQGEL